MTSFGSARLPIAAVLMIVACSARTIDGADTLGAVEIRVKATASTATIDELDVHVSSAKATFTLQYSEADDMYHGVLHLPAGEHLLAATAYDPAGVHIASGNATAAIETGRTALVYIALYAPPPASSDRGPVITAVAISKTSVSVGEPVLLTATGIDPDGDTVDWDWHSTCSGMFSSIATSSSVWSSDESGTCTLSATASANGLSDTRVFGVVVAVGEGRADVTLSRVPRPLVKTFSLETATGACAVTRDAIDATCHAKVLPGRTVGGTVSFELGAPTRAPSLEVISNCGGVLTEPSTTVVGAVGKSAFQWTAPNLTDTVCVLTARLTHAGRKDEFAVAILVDDLNAAEVFDLTALHLASYRMAKRAAVSYTFDDGPMSSFALANIFARHDFRAEFFIIAGSVDARGTWPQWRAVADNGHAVSNHTMHHLDLSNPALTDEQLSEEIEGAQRLIEEKLGRPVLTLAFPYSGATAQAAELALRSHLATRNVGLPFSAPNYRVLGLSSQTTAAVMERELIDAVVARAWLVMSGHGIDGDGASPLPSEVLEANLALAQEHVEELWVDTFTNVAKYKLALGTARISVVAVSERSFRVHLEGVSDPALASVPLTVEIPIVHASQAACARNVSGYDVPITLTQSAALLEMSSGDEVEVSLCSNP